MINCQPRIVGYVSGGIVTFPNQSISESQCQHRGGGDDDKKFQDNTVVVDSGVESDIPNTNDKYYDDIDEYPQACILSKIVNEIELNCNYDLMWIKYIFSQTKELFISNKWKCAFNHIPMEWIFGIGDIYSSNSNDNATVNNNNSSGNSFTKKCQSLEILGSTSDNFYLSCNALTQFATKYNDYFVNKCESNKSRVREMKRIWYNVKSRHNWKLLSKLNGNFQSAMFQLFNKRSVSRFPNLKRFFSIFHCNLTILELYVAKHKRSQSLYFSDNDDNDDNDDGNNNNSINTHQLLSLLFKRNDTLIKQLETSEVQLSFETFLSMHGYITSNLPQIKELYVNFIANIQDKTSIALLNSDKLMKLFNLSNSVENIYFQFYTPKNCDRLKYSCIKWIQRLINLVRVEIVICVTQDSSIIDIKQFYKKFLLDLIIECVINRKVQIIDIDIGYEPQVCNQINKSEILIENKQMLSHQQRNELKEMIVNNVLKPRFEAIKNIWKFKFDQLVDETQQIQERILIKQAFHV